MPFYRQNAFLIASKDGEYNIAVQYIKAIHESFFSNNEYFANKIIEIVDAMIDALRWKTSIALEPGIIIEHQRENIAVWNDKFSHFVDQINVLRVHLIE